MATTCCVKVTLEVVAQGTTCETNPCFQGMTHSGDILNRGKSVTVIEVDQTGTGAAASRFTNITKLLALARAKVSMPNVKTDLDALSP